MSSFSGKSLELLPPDVTHTTYLATEALLLPGYMFGTASQRTCMIKTLPITVLGMN